jgi:hypothetical protein
MRKDSGRELTNQNKDEFVRLSLSLSLSPSLSLSLSLSHTHKHTYTQSHTRQGGKDFGLNKEKKQKCVLMGKEFQCKKTGHAVYYTA